MSKQSYLEGYQARLDDKPVDDNPYPPSPWDPGDWILGWESGDNSLQGYNAYFEGQNENPHGPSLAKVYWGRGWLKAQEESEDDTVSRMA